MKLFNFFKRFFQSAFFTFGLFWSWNFLFAIILFWIEAETSFIVNLIRDIFQGRTPFDLAFFGLLIAFLPIACIVLGFTKFKGNKKKILHLFYGVEGPLLMFCWLRLTVLRELTAGTAHLLFLALVGGLFYFYGLLNENIKSNKLWNFVRFTAHVCMLLVGLLVAIILSFYFLPSVAGLFYLIGEIISNISFVGIFSLGFFGGLFLLFFFYTATLFLFTPIVLPFLYGKAFGNAYQQALHFLGKRNTLVVLSGVILLNVFLFANFNWGQSQTKAFQLLEKSPETLAEQRALVEQDEEIREGLLNSYLASYRYISAVENNNHIEELYMESLSFPRAWASAVQDLYNVFTKPFLYEGNMRSDKQKAMKKYETFFDRPIDKFEKDAISSAIEATWDRDGVEASLLNINEEKVLLKSQSVSIKEEEQWAEVELYEVYQNQSFRREEIFYYFSLPEAAVITGLWLSDDSVKKKFPFRVSPRGAAQEVYKQEVQRRVDPSLLEQVGPRQYRLRAFPILPKVRSYGRGRSSNYLDGPDFHLWLQYKLPITGKQIEFPKLLERRNVYWDESTVYSVNGDLTEKLMEEWYPNEYQLKKAHSWERVHSQLTDSTLVSVEEYELNKIDMYHKKMAVFIDQSYSMNEHKEELIETLEALKKQFEPATIDVFLDQKEQNEIGLQSLLTGTQEEESDFFNFFGNKPYLNSLHKLKKTIQKRNYKFLLVISDQGSYELLDDSVSAFHSDIPVYIYHLGGKLAAVYSDAEIETLEQSRGKGLVSIQDLADDLQFKRLQKKDSKLMAYVDGLLFKELDSSGESKTKGFAQIAARQYVKNKSQELETENRLAVMDQIHSIAKSFDLVSPYSSMIVLVNERQHQALNKAEKRDDRFDREIENGGTSLSIPSNPFEVSGTPEPEEWMLIIIVSVLLLFSVLKGRLF